MSNLDIWSKFREVPKTALKEIKGGRLKGMSDINPVWKMKILTEQFGPCGFGWKYVITSQRLEPSINGEVSAFVDINLYYKIDEQWSDAVPGIGGNSFVAKESAGLHASDECFKMALTDAIGVACKAIGIGADVYFNSDRTKYDVPETPVGERNTTKTTGDISDAQVKRLFAIASAANKSMKAVKEVILRDYNKTSVESLSKEEYNHLCEKLQALIKPKTE